ncbi:DNA adenine methylase Dam [Desulfosporosinus acidiphilus SJ4]|uniref:site-specific DNA-methyltransferase (adenine-specific) n=1 Tax=Desulfosporosinus acidiphilus (strain DSM 22704 / JCM 16185 / SJ4) TaxID=646529 RepID=I4DB07_DESAJ|nr:DNA adenine methylase [Desulfosporosinus acidiphilus]AFM42981.1 DNA adenine methylase Dam [Desulfosporosinus acidiphilus SJ4]
MNSPIKWMGGKFRLRNRILEMLPQDHLCFVEVFGGAGWVLFAKSLSKIEVLNDVNGELINFFKVVRDKTQDFIRAFEYLLVSRQIFEEYKRANPQELDDIERAVRFYYLVHFSFGARMQSFIISPTGVRLVLKTLEQEIKQTRERLLNTIIENRDFEKLILSYDRPSTLFYCDPPYYGLTGYSSQGSRVFTVEDHIRLRDVLSRLQGRYLLSINDHPDIRELYNGFNIEEVSLRYSVSRKDKSTLKKELLISNYYNSNIANSQIAA